MTLVVLSTRRIWTLRAASRLESCAVRLRRASLQARWDRTRRVGGVRVNPLLVWCATKLEALAAAIRGGG